MAGPIVHTTSAGATVATDVGPGGEGYQLIKLVDGSASATVPIGATSGIPAASSVGLIVTPKPGASVTVVAMPAVSGTVQVSGPIQVSGTITVNTAPTVAGASVTVQQGISVSAQVSGTISVSNLPGSTTGSSGMSGVLVWLGASQTVIVNTAPTVAGASVTIQQGASVSAVVSGTVTVNGSVAVSGTAIVSVVPGVSVSLGQMANIVVTTTATSGVSGPVVWIGANQTLGTINVVNTVVTVLSTVNVAIVAGAGGGGSVTTSAPSISATGQVVWLAGGQSTTAFPVVITGTVSGGAGIGTTVTGQTSLTAQLVWLAPTQTMAAVSTIATILSTVNVAIVAGAGGGGSVTTSAPSISATGQVMWVAGGQSTSAFPLYVSQINPPAGGGGSVTTAVPSISATGQIMFIVGGQSTTAFPVFVSHVATQVVSVVPGVSVTIQQGASVSAVVSGTITVNGSVAVSGTAIVTVVPGVSVSLGGLANVVVTTTATSGVSGPVVWLGANQTLNTINVLNTVVTVLSTVNVAIVAGAGGGGSVTTSAPSISATGQVMWVAGGQSTTAFPIFVSQINAPAAGGGSVTTSAPSISATGQVVWIAGGQSSTAFPVGVAVSGAVAAVTTQTAVTGAGVWLAPTQTIAAVSTIATILSTVNVAIVAGAGGGGSVTTAVPSISATGQVMWIAGGQSTTAFPAFVSHVGSQIVSVIPGLSVSAVVSGTVSVLTGGGLPGSTTGSSGMSGVLVWLGASQSVLIGGQSVTIQQGASVSAVVSGTVAISIPVSQTVGTIIAVSGVTAVSVVSTIVTILGTQVVTVVPGLSVSAVVSGTVTVATGTVVALDGPGRTNVMFVIPSTSVGISGTMLSMTVYQGITVSATATTGYIVPAGKVLRIVGFQAVVLNSITTSPVLFRGYIVVSTAAPTWSSTVPIAAAVQMEIWSASVGISALGVQVCDFAAGQTVGVAMTIGTSGASIQQMVCNGFLFG
mgnify:CR=1 FL=1